MEVSAPDKSKPQLPYLSFAGGPSAAKAKVTTKQLTTSTRKIAFMAGTLVVTGMSRSLSGFSVPILIQIFKSIPRLSKMQKKSKKQESRKSTAINPGCGRADCPVERPFRAERQSGRTFCVSLKQSLEKSANPGWGGKPGRCFTFVAAPARETRALPAQSMKSALASAALPAPKHFGADAADATRAHLLVIPTAVEAATQSTQSARPGFPSLDRGRVARDVSTSLDMTNGRIQ